MARVGHVRVDLEGKKNQSAIQNMVQMIATYTTVSTVGPPTALGSLVYLDVLYNEVRGVEALAIGVRLGVL